MRHVVPRARHLLLRHSLHILLPILGVICGLAGLKRVGLHTSVHLREEEAEDALSVLPLEVVQVNLVRECLRWVLALRTLLSMSPHGTVE